MRYNSYAYDTINDINICEKIENFFESGGFMEIERKYEVKEIPARLEEYPYKKIEQGYLCSNPTIRIRKSNDDYYITYKSKQGLIEKQDVAIINQEVELPLSKEAYETLAKKIDGNMVYKTRYLIPLENNLLAELDIFEGVLEGLVFVEVEFSDEEQARNFQPPAWFGADLSKDRRYTNQYLSKLSSIKEFSQQ